MLIDQEPISVQYFMAGILHEKGAMRDDNNCDDQMLLDYRREDNHEEEAAAAPDLANGVAAVVHARKQEMD